MAFPKGATLPTGVDVSDPLRISLTAAEPLKFTSAIGVVVWPTVILPDPVSVNAPALDVVAVYLKVQLMEPVAPR
jgi:hypothetical protein